MPNDDNKIILEFPATNVEIELGETITFDNISGFLDSERVTYNGESLTDEIAHLEDGKAEKTYVDEELDKKADKDTTYTKTQVDNALNDKMDKDNPTGTGSFSLGRKDGTVIGNHSVAVGLNTTASAIQSHAEGSLTVASGTNSHSEGAATTASGNNSHAEGIATTASGNNSHAEGGGTTASSENSHAEGAYTIANHKSQHVFGEYNTPDDSTAQPTARGNYVEIVGNGTGVNNRSNARTLDWEGNETLAGDLTFNGNKSLAGEISRLDGRITDLPEPMVFKGTLGVGGTIETLPTASASNEGWMFKCITAGTYAGLTLKVGDTVTCFNPPNTSTYYWDRTGSQDTDTDTWRNIKVNGVEKLGNGISSGAVDFEDTTNVKFEFDDDGNKVRAKLDGIYTDSEVDDLLDEKADKSNTYTQEQVNNIVSDAIYNILPSELTPTGAVANFSTTMELPIKSLEADVNAVQEAGTPTPATPLPISGWNAISLVHCGSNFFDISTKTNDKALKWTDGDTFNDTKSIVSDYIEVKEGIRFTSNYLAQWCCYDKDKNYLGNILSGSLVKTIGSDRVDNTIPSGYGVYYLRLGYRSSQNNNEDMTEKTDIMLNIGNTAIPFEPYNGNTEVITLGGTYYGGHFTQDKAGHRQFEVTHIAFDDWANKNVKLYGINTHGIANFYLDHFSQLTKANVGICNLLTKQTSLYSETTDEGFLVNPSTQYIRVLSTRASTIEEFKTWADNNDLMIINELATPIVIDLPDGEPIATLIGTNNIYADTGDCAVEYKCSVAEYVANHSGGGGAKSLGGVFLGGSNSSSEEEPAEESEETEKTKEIDEPKEEIKTIGDMKKLGGE